MVATQLQSEINKCLESLKNLKETNDELVELAGLLVKARGLNITSCTKAEIEEIMYGFECLLSEIGSVSSQKEMEYNSTNSYYEFMKAKMYLELTEPKFGQPKHTQDKAKAKVVVELNDLKSQVNLSKFMYSHSMNLFKSVNSMVSVFQSILKGR